MNDLDIQEVLLVVDITAAGLGNAVTAGVAEKTGDGVLSHRVIRVDRPVENDNEAESLLITAIDEIRANVDTMTDRMALTVVYLYQANFAPAIGLTFWLRMAGAAARRRQMRSVRHAVCWLVDETVNPLPDFNLQRQRIAEQLRKLKAEGQDGAVYILSDTDAGGKPTAANRTDAIATLAVLLGARKVLGAGVRTMGFAKLQITHREVEAILSHQVAMRMDAWPVERSIEMLAKQCGISTDVRGLLGLVQSWMNWQARYVPVLPDDFYDARRRAEGMWPTGEAGSLVKAKKLVNAWEAACQNKARNLPDIRMLTPLFEAGGALDTALDKALEDSEVQLQTAQMQWAQLEPPRRGMLQDNEHYCIRCMKLCADAYSQVQRRLYQRQIVQELQLARGRICDFIAEQHARRRAALQSLFVIDERKMSGYRRMAEDLVKAIIAATDQLEMSQIIELDCYYPVRASALRKACERIVRAAVQSILNSGDVTRDLVQYLAQMNHVEFEGNFMQMLRHDEEDKMLATSARQYDAVRTYFIHSARLDVAIAAWQRGRTDQVLSATGFDNAERLCIYDLGSDLGDEVLRARIPMFGHPHALSNDAQESAWKARKNLVDEADGETDAGEQEASDGDAQEEARNPWALRVDRTPQQFMLRMSWAERTVESIRLVVRGFSARAEGVIEKPAQEQTWQRSEYNLSPSRDITALVQSGSNYIAIYDRDRKLAEDTFLGKQEMIPYRLKRAGTLSEEDCVFARMQVIMNSEDVDTLSIYPEVEIVYGGDVITTCLGPPKHRNKRGKHIHVIYVMEDADVRIQPAPEHHGVFTFAELSLD